LSRLPIEYGEGMVYRETTDDAILATHATLVTSTITLNICKAFESERKG